MKKRARTIDLVFRGVKNIRFLLLFLTLRAAAQVSTATVVGTVQDSSSDSIPNAQLKLMN